MVLFFLGTSAEVRVKFDEFQNSKQNLFQRGYTNLRDELSGMLRRIEINRATSGNSNITLLIEQTGDQNLVKITHSGTTHNLAYLDPDLSGKVIYSGMNFIESNSSEIAEVLQIVEGANFKKSTNLVAYNKKFTIVKTNSGLVKVVDGVVSGPGGSQLWTSIDEFEGLFNGKDVTFYDVNVTYQTGRVRAGIAFEENGILNFDINLPSNLQGQGVGTEIFSRAINDYSPSQVQGLWKSSDNYLGGESINLTIFKQKIADGMTEIQAAFETPTGKILKANGFGGTPTILINTSSEVKIIFNP
ncbi:hypothetical protein Fluta_0335 [Fluviicola taffensis DSM 16823]|uniref:Uncharacterized protein n=1 Tax=Fluviicola taffensis (strain DSM 16823 / NCIMB 13979 / RW262) TaxID=755732 RepID=F2IDG8_FLUTR|nr:hypothetical protein Fluta_0335 [Fluviicola taffensis DSM 16823]